MDEKSLWKTYAMVGAIWFVSCLVGVLLAEPYAVINMTIGTVICTALLATLQMTVRSLVCPGVRKPRRTLVKAWLLKYPVVFGLLYLVVRWDKFSPGFFVVGAATVYVAITVQAVAEMFRSIREVGSELGRY